MPRGVALQGVGHGIPGLCLLGTVLGARTVWFSAENTAWEVDRTFLLGHICVETLPHCNQAVDSDLSEPSSALLAVGALVPSSWAAVELDQLTPLV